MSEQEAIDLDRIYEVSAARIKCEEDHLYFTRYFFKARQNIKFKVNWHHRLISDKIQSVIDGKIKNLIINVAPGSSKTELVVINLIARGLALNPRARFLHLSGSDSLALLNSATARDLIQSDAFQELWPLKVNEDAKSKKRWNVLVNGQAAGGVYATSLGGQITGFRAGHMETGFQGAIIIDDPMKPEDIFSKSKIDQANRKLITTIKSRRANPDTPIIIIMQRISEDDVTNFVQEGNLEIEFDHVIIPALITEDEVKKLGPQYYDPELFKNKDEKNRASYWAYKEPIESLKKMEKGGATDQTGARISRFVFTSQYQQRPVMLGGNIFKGDYFPRYKILPKMKYRMVYADTAQKTKERNDFSVFECWGEGVDGKIYLLDLLRGKWEAPELLKRAIAFWKKHQALDVEKYAHLRKMKVEDKSSGTGLIQTLKLPPYNIPIEGIERNKDKFERANDVLPYVEASLVCVPEEAAFTNDFISEAESFTADDSHQFDDQLDPMFDAVMDMLFTGNIAKKWEAFGN